MRLVITVLLLFSSFCLFPALCLAQTIDDAVIPRKTEVFITLERALNSKTAAPGDSFFGRVAVPLTQDDKIIIPAGSYVKGQVESRKKAGRIKGTGEMTLRFNLLILPDGITREFQAKAFSAEGYETKGGSEEGEIKAQDKQGTDVGKGMIYGAPIGASVGVAVGAGAERNQDEVLRGVRTGAAVGAAGGAAVGALVGLLLRNEEVDLAKGTVITVILDEDVRFTKPAPEKPKQPL